MRARRQQRPLPTPSPHYAQESISSKLTLALRICAGCFLAMMGGSLAAHAAPGPPEAYLIDMLFAAASTVGGFLVLRSARRSMNLDWDKSATRRPLRTRRWDIVLAVLMFGLMFGSIANRNAENAQRQAAPASATAAADYEEAASGVNADSAQRRVEPAIAAAAAYYEDAARELVTTVWSRAPVGSDLEPAFEFCRYSEECIEDFSLAFFGACLLEDAAGGEAAEQKIREVFYRNEFTSDFGAESTEMVIGEFSEALRTSC